ncbi:hypothetical protein AB1L88_23975 [Tautonia sp. JC769]|uniref:hypothetical protein n=1 Tax=Tautonia sp. JC769 TaxID=3232135 RepID=UPI0034594F93
MDWSMIGAIGQWFAGFITLAVLVYAVWQDYWKRPKLLISFNNEEDVKSQGNTVGLDPHLGSRWLRVRVQNKPGRKVAKNCRSYLIGVEHVNSGENYNLLPHDVRPLDWMHDKPESFLSRDLLPGVAHWVNIIGAIEQQDYLKVCVYPSFALQIPGVYVLTIQVSAEDANPSVVKIRIYWDGNWESLRGERIS